MSDRAAGAASGKGGTRWGAVALGWVLAVLTGIVTGTILRQAYGLLADPLVEGGELTATVVVISVVSGFLSYLVGGYAAASMAGPQPVGPKPMREKPVILLGWRRDLPSPLRGGSSRAKRDRGGGGSG